MLVPILLIVGFSACLLAFQLALGTHFRHSGSLAPAMRGVIALSVAVWAAATYHLLLRGAPSAQFLAPAVAMLAGSATLFAVTRLTTPSKVLPAAFANEAPAFVIEKGPYRFVRHPFYTAYMLFWVGFGLAAPHPVVAVGVVLLLAAYVYLARREERFLLQGPLGESYGRYVRSTGRFFPRLW